MSKIICDICGTTYPANAESCPICGCTRDAAAEFLGEELAVEDVVEETKGKAGKFTPKKKKEIFDFDEVNDGAPLDLEEEQNPFEEEEEEEEYEEQKGGGAGIIVILTILIVALLVAAGFIFFRYFLPSMKADDPEPVNTEALEVVQPEAPTTEAGIPCQMLILTSGTAELSQPGQMFLLHVAPTPEDTTDEIIFTSGDESIATVSSDGTITAVSEGETVIYISCGEIQTTCPVVCRFVEETVPPTEETVPATEETVPEETEAAEETEATEPEETQAALKDVTLKLKQTDIRLGVYYEYQLKLDCDLEQNEVEWTSEHPHIVKVDENGVITALKDGTTSVIVKYGDQEASCIVRCSY